MGEQSAAGYREGHLPKASLDFSSLLLGLSLAIADGNRSFLNYEIVAVTVLCIQMCPHTLSAHSLRERLHHCQIFTAYYTENKRYLSRMRTQ